MQWKCKVQTTVKLGLAPPRVWRAPGQDLPGQGVWGGAGSHQVMYCTVHQVMYCTPGAYSLQIIQLFAHLHIKHDVHWPLWSPDALHCTALHCTALSTLYTTPSSRQPLQELQRVMKERFAESEFLTGVPEKLGGAICMQVNLKLHLLVQS